MIESLITSKTRINLLIKFFLNCQIKSHLRGLELEFGESSNSVRVELNRLEKAGLLNSALEGNKKMYFANTTHPLYFDINNIVKKHIDIELISSHIFEKVPNLDSVYLTGDLANGKNSETIDFILEGNNLDELLIKRLINEVETVLTHRIMYSINHAVENINPGDRKNLFKIWQHKI